MKIALRGGEGAGRSAENQRQRGEVVERRARLAKLTPREFEVFRLVSLLATSLSESVSLLRSVGLGTNDHLRNDFETGERQILPRPRLYPVGPLVFSVITRY